ncbi:MAG: hypothetical protein ABWZ75_08175 [Novosphingobium sp.]
MIARTGSGWQYALADLSLILFMVTAAALSQTDTKDVARPSLQGETLAVWGAAPDAPSLADWLALQAPDRRQQLTIVARYTPGEQDKALAKASALAASAGEAGHRARIVVEPGEGGITAALAYDAPLVLARGLQDQAASQPQQDYP